MASERLRILLCLIVCCVGVTTRSLEDYDFNSYDYKSYYQQRSNTQQQSQPETLNIAMPEIHPTKHDSYFCTSLKIDNPDTYIVGYQPHAEMHTAHHMLLFGCEYPPSKDKFWNCGDMGVGVCGRDSGEKIMYAWGRNAKVLELPKDVGFKVGDKDSKYLVLQVHYGHVDKFKKNEHLTDHSGVTLEVKYKRPDHLAAILLLATGGEIPAQKKAFNLDMGCKYTGQTVIHPFAFRVHAHSLGSVITGYRIRNNKWELIGKGDPQRPQAFYSIGKEIDIRNGDILAGQCTYNTMKKQKTTYIGATMKDEMCNFYMMYYYDSSTSDSAAPGDYCRAYPVNPADYPADSVVPLPGSGKKMEMKRDEAESADTKRSMSQLKEEPNWPIGGSTTGKLPFASGQITGVSMDTKGNVVLFHRSSRPWGIYTFDENNILTHRTPIPDNTVTWLDPKTGKVLYQWGAGLFYLPHGLTVDENDNLWLTDIGSHQIYKYSRDYTSASIPYKASITLGTKFQPGSDNNHFCKPTSVALDAEDNFFVADGYCNQRVLKYSPTGRLLMIITNQALSQVTPHHFTIPHSASIDKLNNELYIADRENGRVLVFNTKSGKLVNKFTGYGQRVFAAHYSPANGGILHIVNGDDGKVEIQGYTFSLQSHKVTQTWKPKEGFHMPHDVVADNTGNVVYVAEVLSEGGRIWKFD